MQQTLPSVDSQRTGLRCKLRAGNSRWLIRFTGRDCRSQVQAESSTSEQAQTTNKILREHAQRLVKKASILEKPQKYLVGIAGCPGSGKTTAAGKLKTMVEELSASREGQRPCKVEVASMDGFHYYRKELDEMEDPDEAHARRGAHWTFNAELFVDTVKALKRNGHALLPSFDHAYGDPVEKDVSIAEDTQLVIIEGNYLLLDTDPWKQLKAVFDESWFIDCSLDVAMSRVFHRQVRNGSKVNVAKKRVNGNDRPNAELIMTTAKRADHVIRSKENGFD